MVETTLCYIAEDERYPVVDVITKDHPYWGYHSQKNPVNVPTEIIEEYNTVYARWDELNDILLDYKRKATKLGQ